ncbi:preprotein translocase subunit SecG [bacterium]
MTVFLTIIHVLVCVFLIMSILLQSSKGGGLAGMFGGGGGGMGGVFGGRGAASFLSKVAMWLGIGFAVTSILIALLSSGTPTQPKSLIEQVMEQEQDSSPATLLPTVPGGGGEQTGVVEPEGEKPPQE